MVKNPGGPTMPAFWSFGFPRKETAEEFKNKGWLKPETKVEVSTSVIWDGHGVRLRDNFFSRYYWFSLMFFWTIWPLSMTKVIPSWIIIPFLLFWTLSIISMIRQTKKAAYKSLGDLEMSETFLFFLNKFAKGWDVRIAAIPNNIAYAILKVFKQNLSTKKWWIEYGLLVEAYRLYQENPADFEKIIKKAKNKKELRWAMGVS